MRQGGHPIRHWVVELFTLVLIKKMYSPVTICSHPCNFKIVPCCPSVDGNWLCSVHFELGFVAAQKVNGAILLQQCRQVAISLSAVCGLGWTPPPPYPFTSPSFTVSFTFYFFPFLLALSVFLRFHPFPFYPNRSTPFPGSRSKEATEPGLFFCWFCVMCFFVKDTCLFLVVFDFVLFCGVIVVSPCCRL